MSNNFAFSPGSFKPKKTNGGQMLHQKWLLTSWIISNSEDNADCSNLVNFSGLG